MEVGHVVGEPICCGDGCGGGHIVAAKAKFRSGQLAAWKLVRGSPSHEMVNAGRLVVHSTVIIIPYYSEAAGEAEVHWKEGGHWWCPASASVTASLPTNQYPNHPPTSPFQIKTKLFPNKPKNFFCTANQPISQRQPKLT